MVVDSVDRRSPESHRPRTKHLLDATSSTGATKVATDSVDGKAMDSVDVKAMDSVGGKATDSVDAAAMLMVANSVDAGRATHDHRDTRRRADSREDTQLDVVALGKAFVELDISWEDAIESRAVEMSILSSQNRSLITSEPPVKDTTSTVSSSPDSTSSRPTESVPSSKSTSSLRKPISELSPATSSRWPTLLLPAAAIHDPDTNFGADTPPTIEEQDRATRPHTKCAYEELPPPATSNPVADFIVKVCSRSTSCPFAELVLIFLNGELLAQKLRCDVLTTNTPLSSQAQAPPSESSNESKLDALPRGGNESDVDDDQPIAPRWNSPVRQRRAISEGSVGNHPVRIVRGDHRKGGWGSAQEPLKFDAESVLLRSGEETTCKAKGCGSRFESRSLLKVHQRTCVLMTDCTMQGCNKRFTRESNMRTHVKKQHTGQSEEHKCSKCDQVCTTAYNLGKHMKRHVGKRDYVCDHPGCKAAFVQKSTLTTHKKNKHATPYKCPHTDDGCELRFATMKENIAHQLRVHEALKPIRTGTSCFRCTVPECNERFQAIEARNLHEEWCSKKVSTGSTSRRPREQSIGAASSKPLLAPLPPLAAHSRLASPQSNPPINLSSIPKRSLRSSSLYQSPSSQSSSSSSSSSQSFPSKRRLAHADSESLVAGSTLLTASTQPRFLSSSSRPPPAQRRRLSDAPHTGRAHATNSIASQVLATNSVAFLQAPATNSMPYEQALYQQALMTNSMTPRQAVATNSAASRQAAHTTTSVAFFQAHATNSVASGQALATNSVPSHQALAANTVASHQALAITGVASRQAHATTGAGSRHLGARMLTSSAAPNRVSRLADQSHSLPSAAVAGALPPSGRVTNIAPPQLTMGSIPAATATGAGAIFGISAGSGGQSSHSQLAFHMQSRALNTGPTQSTMGSIPASTQCPLSSFGAGVSSAIPASDSNQNTSPQPVTAMQLCWDYPNATSPQMQLTHTLSANSLSRAMFGIAERCDRRGGDVQPPPNFPTQRPSASSSRSSQSWFVGAEEIKQAAPATPFVAAPATPILVPETQVGTKATAATSATSIAATPTPIAAAPTPIVTAPTLLTPIAVPSTSIVADPTPIAAAPTPIAAAPTPIAAATTPIAVSPTLWNAGTLAEGQLASAQSSDSKEPLYDDFDMYLPASFHKRG